SNRPPRPAVRPAVAGTRFRNAINPSTPASTAGAADNPDSWGKPDVQRIRRMKSPASDCRSEGKRPPHGEIDAIGADATLLSSAPGFGTASWPRCRLNFEARPWRIDWR